MWASQSWQPIALFALHGVFHATEDSQSKAFIADLEPDRRAAWVGALWASDPRWAFGLAAVQTAAARRSGGAACVRWRTDASPGRGRRSVSAIGRIH